MSNRQILKTENVLVRIMELDGGTTTDWHYHSEVADFFVCLTGAVQVETRDPDHKILLAPGQHAEAAPLQTHRVVNTGKGKAEYLLIQGVGAYDFCRSESL